MTSTVSTEERPPDAERGAIPRPWAAGVGLVTVGAALGVGDLVAGLVSPPSSPVLAVGAQFIRMTPEWLKEFATSTFGTWDKTVLLGGMGVALIAVALATGLVSRRRPGPGLALVVVLGLVAAAAATASPTFTAADLVAPLAALVVGVVALLLLHRRALAAARSVRTAEADGPTEETDADTTGPVVDPARRRLMIGLGVGVAVAGVSGAIGRRLAGAAQAEASRAAVGPLPAAAPSGPPVRNLAGADFAADGTARWLTANSDFYRIDTALQVPQVSTTGFTLRIHGMVERELRLSYEDLRRRPLIEAPITMCCVSNDIGGNLISNAVFTGVSLRELLAEAGVRPGAQQIASTSVDGFTTGTPVATVTDGRTAMLALGMNGEPLPLEHGFPVRMVVPGLYGFVSGCKWITDMEITTWAAKTSYWKQRGWGEQAPIKTQSRIDVPRNQASVPAGRVVVAGTAWAQHTGIDRVEVRADAGGWQPAELSREIDVDTWRMWRTVLTLPRGDHQLQVRAIDRTGYAQTPQFSLTIPDGATGWHTITVTAT